MYMYVGNRYDIITKKGVIKITPNHYFVGQSVEISNHFIEDYRLLLDFAKWGK